MAGTGGAAWPERLETARLTLRRMTVGDLPVLTRELGRWEVARWLVNVPHPYSYEDAAAWLAITMTRFKAGTGFHLVAQPKDGAEMVGGIGLILDGRGRGAPPGQAELGYWLAPAAWGMGYGTEMARAVVHMGFKALGLAIITAAADPANDASHRVLLKAGLRPTHLDPYHHQGLRGPPGPARIYRIDRKEWECGIGK